MRRLTALVLGFALISAGLPTQVFAQQILGAKATFEPTMAFPDTAKKDKGVIEGNGIDAMKGPIASHVIRLNNHRMNRVAETTASTAGAFTFLNVDPGEDYIIEVLRQDPKDPTNYMRVGIASKLVVKPGIVTKVNVTAGTGTKIQEPHGGFHWGRFFLYTAIITVVAIIAIDKRRNG